MRPPTQAAHAVEPALEYGLLQTSSDSASSLLGWLGPELGATLARFPGQRTRCPIQLFISFHYALQMSPNGLDGTEQERIKWRTHV